MCINAPAAPCLYGASMPPIDSVQRLRFIAAGLRTTLLALSLAGPCFASDAVEVPTTVTLEQARQLAREHRYEVRAALAQVRAARQKPAIAGALEDPVISPAIDHYPDNTMRRGDSASDMDATASGAESDRRYDWSVTLEQSFPLSRLRAHRRDAARADADRQEAEAERVILDVEQNAVQAYVMLYEARQMAQLSKQQQKLAAQLVDTAAVRYASAQGSQSEVLRAEVESARAAATIRKADADLRSAEAMFNASLGRALDTPVPELADPVSDAEPADAAMLRGEALRDRPELRAGLAEIARADADVRAMKSMYLPMGMLRIGRASTMAEGPGTMAMVGMSLPIWTGRLRAGVAEAEAMQQMAQADVEAMRRMVEAETVAAREAVIGARHQYLALRDDVLPRAHMALAPAQAAYRSGQGSMTALIETLRTLWMVQADLVMSRSQLALAWARLLRAIGTTGEEP